jgi:hypothetical protein
MADYCRRWTFPLSKPARASGVRVELVYLDAQLFDDDGETFNNTLSDEMV